MTSVHIILLYTSILLIIDVSVQYCFQYLSVSNDTDEGVAVIWKCLWYPNVE